MAKSKQDSDDRKPKPLSDEEIKKSVMGESSALYDRMKRGDRDNTKDDND
jgi:hypothetical protein